MTSEYWDNLDDELFTALSSFDWPVSDDLAIAVASSIRRDVSNALPAVERMLKRLRRKRRFRSIGLVADALFETKSASIAVGRHYAQSLTDLGYLEASERMLESLAQWPALDKESACELHGMRGRVAKQRHVNTPDAASDRARAYLDEAVRHYLTGYRLDRDSNFWHGINAVALIMRAQRKGITLHDVPSAEDTARAVLQAVTAPRPGGRDPEPFEVATELEGHVALNDLPRAIEAAQRYVGNQRADAFEIESTRRQLAEVWELTDEEPPGSDLLPLLRAAVLAREGGAVEMSAQSVTATLERNFGGDFQYVQWFQEGLRCCASVARIEAKTGGAHGTGWLFRRRALYGGDSEEPLLITNAHVLNIKGDGGALRPDRGLARFEVLNHVTDLGKVVWSSPVPDCDATIVTLASPPADATGLSVSDVALQMNAPGQQAPRLYVIGYPRGGSLAFSINDNIMVGCNAQRVHYRTATEPGSSGSPVFDKDWQVVGLHHLGKDRLPRLDNPAQQYEANEGISIGAIQTALKVV
jgi:hypothetical protein